jgi:BirA family transcriptional regulator, biotin operon repressor / biotin---[acetyl-CoA-carboxylase] ligase
VSEVFPDLERLGHNALGARVEWYATLPSTNNLALERASIEDCRSPLLIIAEEQTAGRGRRDNRWWSSRGALTFSLLFNPASVVPAVLRAEHWPRIALTAGLALCETIDEFRAEPACGLKWPNDVLLGGRKVAGILVEIPPARPDAPRPIVLGMGVNVNNSLSAVPVEVAARGTSLRDAARREIDRDELLLSWFARFARHLAALATDSPELPRLWQTRCVLTSRVVEFQTGEQIVRGFCRGIDDDGALLLDTSEGPERLYGGTLVSVSD